MSVDLPARIQLREAVTPADGLLEGPRVLHRSVTANRTNSSGSARSAG